MSDRDEMFDDGGVDVLASRCDWCGKREGDRIYDYDDSEPALCCDDPSCIAKAEASGWQGMSLVSQ